MRVMLGGCTCSIAASSPNVMGPSASIVVSAARRRRGEVVAGAGALLADPAGEAGDRDPQRAREPGR